MDDPISILSLVDLCLKYGQLLVQRCSAVAHANKELQERKVRVENYWMRTKLQLGLLQQVEGILNGDLRDIQHETLQILLSKLQIADESLQVILKNTGLGKVIMRIRKWKYHTSIQQKIDKAIQELELWQRLFDPSWFLIMKSTSWSIEATLQSYPHGSASATRTSISSVLSIGTSLHTDRSYQDSGYCTDRVITQQS